MSPHPDTPPPPESGSLVPGSRYSDADWALAAHRLASGWPVAEVARAMGCHRNTVTRALALSPDFRRRMEWERNTQDRELRGRLLALRPAVAARIAEAVRDGDMRTIRWLADRMGMARALAAATVPLPAEPSAEPSAEAEPDSPPLDWQDEFAPDLPRSG